MKKIFLVLLSFCLLTGCQKENLEIREEKEMFLVLQNESYEVTLEKNDTVSKLLTLLPLSIQMQELNGNEKYVYLDTTLPSNPEQVQTIQKGDIMLYQDDCLVLFYKTFPTSYSYTKIGHINNLPDLDNDTINEIICKQNTDYMLGKNFSKTSSFRSEADIKKYSKKEMLFSKLNKLSQKIKSFFTKDKYKGER